MNRENSFWKREFGHTHGLLIVTSFFENVALHDYEHRELKPGEKPTNKILHFDPTPAGPMRVACLWSHWEGLGERPLDSFAAVTDDPPPEIARTGHDRCIVALLPERVDAWLTPEGRSLDVVDALLDRKEDRYYEHRIAA
jgi:putative SOS response-associated peptidase YedK